MTTYRVLKGITYPAKDGERDAAEGDEIADLPAKSAPWLIEQGYIEKVH